jgi:hypothetical protein
MILEPLPIGTPDLIAKPLNSVSATPDTDPTMQHNPNHESSDSPFTMLATTVILFVAFVAICSGCSSGSSTTADPEPPSPPPCYRADEPNDSFETPNLIVPEAAVYSIEGNIHHLDLDCMVVTGENGAPFGEKLVDLSWDYAAGWDMEVSVSWERSDGVAFPLWAAWDQWATGNLATTVAVPAEARRLRLSIGQRTLNNPPDETRYTITVETF